MIPPLPLIMVEPAVRAALLEDLGRAGDLTTDAIVPASAQTECMLVARQPGVVAAARDELVKLPDDLRLARFFAAGHDVSQGVLRRGHLRRRLLHVVGIGHELIERQLRHPGDGRQIHHKRIRTGNCRQSQRRKRRRDERTGGSASMEDRNRMMSLRAGKRQAFVEMAQVLVEAQQFVTT